MVEGSAANAAEGPEVNGDGTLDLNDPVSRLHLIRDAIAVANSGGGRLLIDLAAAPASDDTTNVGFEASNLVGLVEDAVSPDRIDLTATATPTPHVDGKTTTRRALLTIDIAPAQHPPLVPTRAGSHRSDSGDATVVFAAHGVYVRRGGRTATARRDDFERWRAETVESTRAELLDRLTTVVESPRGARIRVFAEDEVRDEPGFLLSRATDLFRQRPDRLLGGADLGYLWQARHSLRFSPTAVELIVQSALRKRATLLLWLSHLDPTPQQIDTYLWRALDMGDRDKSDAARAMLQVAALYSDGDRYEALRQALAASRYAHMQETASEWPTAAEAINSLERHRNRNLSAQSDDALGRMADQMVDRGGPQLNRQLSPIGLELLARTRARSGPAESQH